MANAEISKLNINGNLYNIKDETARNSISTISNSIAGGVHFRGISTTAISDMGTEKATISNTQITTNNGDIVIYDTQEFIYSTSDNKWHKLGDRIGLGSLAYKNDASTTLTQPTWTDDGNQKQAAIVTTPGKGTLKNASSKVTLNGGSSVNAGKATLNSTTIKSAKTLPTMTVSGEVLTFNAGETEDKSVFENSVHASAVDFVCVNDGATINKIVTALHTDGTAEAQVISGAPSVSAYLPGEETTITVS